MPLVLAKCTTCGGHLQVDSSKDAAICPFCGNPYIVEKAINLYTTTNNITADMVNIIGEKDFVIKAGYLEKYNGESTEVVIPNNVKIIGSHVFAHLAIESVLIPNGVTSISWGAFRGCSSLTSINIPDSVTSISFNAFEGCSSLATINIPDGVTSIENSTFKGCSSLASINIPNRVTSIERGAFRGCSSLANINIPNGVTTIEKQTFMDCSSLTNIEIPKSVTQICEEAFKSCSSLTSVSIPDSVSFIGDYAFEGCSSLTSIYNYGAVISYDHNHDNHLIFNGCTNIEKVRGVGDVYILYMFSKDSPIFKTTAKKHGLCPYCGGKFEGLLTKHCSRCQRKKDY